MRMAMKRVSEMTSSAPIGGVAVMARFREIPSAASSDPALHWYVADPPKGGWRKGPALT
jgi:hypothetical protein